ncbi:hypothetical protein N867_11750 [Actinotalea fermentans ATCC 43279 = JCM 9966 = DSM 3133]|nr:hypothetical protein N867_11750 [Actinotalea fermentans ATCC 43279 = JCM 9966 = DSM 3133]
MSPASSRGASQRATAPEFRRQPATTTDPLAAVAAAMAEPFGDGRTNRSTGAASRRVAGDSDGARTAPSRCASARPTARTASCSEASVLARSSFHGDGKTRVPRSAATVTAVEKLSTSTTTVTSARHARAPALPQSIRRANAV